MPGMHGQALVERFRRLRPEVPVVVMTGHPGDLSEDELAEVGAVLAKPFSAQSLAQALACAADRDRHEQRASGAA